MRKIIIAVLVFVPTMFLSGCYVTTSPDNYYYTGYSPGYVGWNSGGIYNNGWYGHRGWYGHGGWGRGGWGHGFHGGGHHGGWGHGGHHR